MFVPQTHAPSTKDNFELLDPLYIHRSLESNSVGRHGVHCLEVNLLNPLCPHIPVMAKKHIFYLFTPFPSYLKLVQSCRIVVLEVRVALMVEENCLWVAP